MYRSRLVNGLQRIYINSSANDLWVRQIVFPGRRNGYFVEAGAADGIGDSSCFLLEKQLGWRGICIEPSDEFFRRLAANRCRSIHENVCLANHNGWVDFAVSSASPYLSGVAEALREHKWRGESVASGAKIIRKKCAVLADLLRLHAAPKVIEYAAFDIEGSEYEALRSFPFDEFRLLALSFEINGTTRRPLSELLRYWNYLEVKNPFNQDCPWETYWVHESIAGDVCARDRENCAGYSAC